MITDNKEMISISNIKGIIILLYLREIVSLNSLPNIKIIIKNLITIKEINKIILDSNMAREEARGISILVEEILKMDKKAIMDNKIETIITEIIMIVLNTIETIIIITKLNNRMKLGNNSFNMC
jgi:hypothetical protein